MGFLPLLSKRMQCAVLRRRANERCVGLSECSGLPLSFGVAPSESKVAQTGTQSRQNVTLEWHPGRPLHSGQSR